MAITVAVSRLRPALVLNSSVLLKAIRPHDTLPLPSTLRSLSSTSILRNSKDPFGFVQPTQGSSLKLRERTDSSTSNLTSEPTIPPRQSQPSSVGSTIFQRMAQSRQNQIQELKRFDESHQINRDEKATPDQLWKVASELKVQSHSGPLTPSSSRVVRTVRIPATSFLNRAATPSDVERAYKRVQFMLNSAKLRKDIYLNKRYEKPYLKRRRLKSERHRTKFAIEVQRRVQIISVMKLRGM